MTSGFASSHQVTASGNQTFSSDEETVLPNTTMSTKVNASSNQQLDIKTHKDSVPWKTKKHTIF